MFLFVLEYFLCMLWSLSFILVSSAWVGLSFLHLSLTLCSLSFSGSYWSPWVTSSEPEPVLEVCALSIMGLLDAGPESAWCLAKVTAAPQTCLSYSALCCWWTQAGCDFSQGLLLLSLASLVMSPAICGILIPPSIELLAIDLLSFYKT